MPLCHHLLKKLLLLLLLLLVLLFLSIFYGQINSRSIASILVVNGDREFTRLNPPSCRVDVELTQVNQICIMYHVTDQLRMSS